MSACRVCPVEVRAYEPPEAVRRAAHDLRGAIAPVYTLASGSDDPLMSDALDTLSDELHLWQDLLAGEADAAAAVQHLMLSRAVRTDGSAWRLTRTEDLDHDALARLGEPYATGGDLHLAAAVRLAGGATARCDGTFTLHELR